MAGGSAVMVLMKTHDVAVVIESQIARNIASGLDGLDHALERRFDIGCGGRATGAAIQTRVGTCAV